MRVLMAGSSGFLGGQLGDRLRMAGHEVTRLVRRDPTGADEVRWDPAAGRVDTAVLSTVDVVVNLAGAGVGDRRWTEAYKRTLWASRVDTTQTLARALAGLPADRRPAVLLNASGVHFYGDTGDRAVDEESAPGEGFFPELCRAWEAATSAAADAGIRVVRMRTGFPLHRSGGLLKPMLLPFRFGVGGRLGNGRQYVPWISLADWLSAAEFVLARDDVAGPVNFTGPDPVTNAAFTRALARQLRRPAVMPVPRLALRALLGEFGNEAVAGLRVLPAVLTRAGFRFRHANVEAALRAALDS